MNSYLAKISDEINKGNTPPPVTTREFLSWFGAQRRGYSIVAQIRRELKAYKLETAPDFESNYIDAPLQIAPVVADRFSTNDLTDVRDPSDGSRTIKGPDDLAFGEYLRLLEKPDRWKQFGLAIDRSSFCNDLDNIRRIRNDVMHFDSDGVLPKELDNLRDFKSFLNQIQSIISPNRTEGKARI
ncbi:MULTISPECIES: hypothetical protein [unclassified Bradyrhizobium]|uniref:hypothetical protein n=1 Tax=unclassified Bradyrhizobium TaxID=2631580 RepID=UPI00247870D7|nr:MULTISPECIES: hypothetical protein [unclassified Bradyrhizobium]WGS22310.1 hypothetical protein MTX22_11945 [Bradyrhizobium sp. ISRA463]WGS29283.1 hypothetical protein MTX19_09725 [Bradyrhizobium sp. ISRA464]